MKLKTLPIIGFNFFKDQFIKLNLEGGTVRDLEAGTLRYLKANQIQMNIKLKKKKQIKLNRHRPEQTDDHLFKLKVDPKSLHYIDLIEQIALQSEELAVRDRSIGLLVNCYLTFASFEET